MEKAKDDKVDIKDHTQHLRTIHFALLATCMALLIVAQHLPGRDWHDAEALLTSLTSSSEEVNWLTKLNGEKLKELEAGVIGEVKRCLQGKFVNDCSLDYRPSRMRGTDPLKDDYYPLKEGWRVSVEENKQAGVGIEGASGHNAARQTSVAFESDGSFCCVKFDLKDGRSFLTRLKFEPALKAGFLSQIAIPSPAKDPTLAQYLKAWRFFNDYNNVLIPWGVEGVSFDPASDAGGLAGRVAVSISGVERGTDQVYEIRLAKDGPGAPLDEAVCRAEGLAPLLDEGLPATVPLKIKFDSKQVLVKPGWWVTGDQRYEEKHTHLEGISKRDWMDKPLSEVKGLVSKEIESKTKAISILNLNIPGTLILDWGALIIVGLQLYFLMHLNFFSEALTPEHVYDVAWIGYYKDFLSKSVFGLTTMLMPFVTTLWLVMKKPTGPESNPWVIRLLIILVFVSAAVAIWTMYPIRKVWRKHPSLSPLPVSPSPPAEAEGVSQNSTASLPAPGAVAPPAQAVSPRRRRGARARTEIQGGARA